MAVVDGGGQLKLDLCLALKKVYLRLFWFVWVLAPSYVERAVLGLLGYCIIITVASSVCAHVADVRLLRVVSMCTRLL